MFIEPDLKDCKTVQDYAYFHRSRYLNNQEEFSRVFKVPLRKFWEGNLLGFDIIGFDKWLQQQTGYDEETMSVSDAVIAHFGQAGNEVIKNLLDIDGQESEE